VLVANVATVIHLLAMAMESAIVMRTDVTLLRRLNAPLRQVDAAAPEPDARSRLRGLVGAVGGRLVLLASAVTLLGGAAAVGLGQLPFAGFAGRAGVAS
jgi:hypothetical protein